MKGFTLLETLLALLVTSILMLVIISYLKLAHHEMTTIEKRQQQWHKAVVAKHLLAPALGNAGFTGCIDQLKYQPQSFWRVESQGDRIQAITVSHLWPLPFDYDSPNRLVIPQLHPRISEQDQLILTDCHHQHWLRVSHVSVDFKHQQQIITTQHAFSIGQYWQLYLWQTIRFSIAPSRINPGMALYRRVNHHQRQAILSGVANMRGQCLNNNSVWSSCNQLQISQAEAIHLQLTLRTNQQNLSMPSRHIDFIQRLHGYVTSVNS